MRGIFPTWRVSDNAALTLSAEWGRTFGNWRVTDEEIDCAIEMCKAEWNRVPDNVTKAFREMLDKAIAKVGVIKNYARAPEISEDEKFVKASADCAKKIKEKNFPHKAWDMHIAAECGEILASLEKTARQGNPKASDLQILRIVWGMV